MKYITNLNQNCDKSSRTKHSESGQNETAEYRIWTQMISRCHLKTNSDYPSYGGRGIKVYESWHNYQIFLKYLLEGDGNYKPIGRRPGKRYSLDRIDNNKGYEPGNIRWATQKEQMNNMRRNLVIDFEGIQYTTAQWGELLGINPTVIRKRLRKNWSIEEVLFIPNMGKQFRIEEFRKVIKELEHGY